MFSRIGGIIIGMEPGTEVPRYHADAVSLSPGQLVSAVRSVVGVDLVAATTGVYRRASIMAWESGSAQIPLLAEQRLRTAYRALRMVSDAHGDGVARTWFLSADPRLGEVSPARTIRDGRPGDVIRAAEEFSTASGR